MSENYFEDQAYKPGEGPKRHTEDKSTPSALLAGRYRIVRQLGRGGMGSVWLAEDEKLDNRRVAVKMLPSVLVDNKRAYAQVKREASLSLKLAHPNIATTRAIEEQGGCPFLVMDYVEGQTLDGYLADKETLTEDETVRILRPIAEALDYAHGEGVVHRDVKPANVMIRKDGHPFILDFGIAREIQETMTRVTGQKDSSGTLMYMSPEQLNGEDPTPAQDIYSFAAMAYECLAGKPPFHRGNIEHQIENKEPPPLCPQFMKCGQGVMAGLAKMPDERPKSCAAVLAGSAQPVASEGCVTTDTPPAWNDNESSEEGKDDRTRIPREPRRRGMLFALIALAVFGVGGYFWGRKSGPAVETPTSPSSPSIVQTTQSDGLYMVVDLTDGSISYLDAVPSGGWTDEHKTSKIVLRRIEPGTFTMGSHSGEEGRFDDENSHEVTLTKPYYIGVFEVTQGQWDCVMGSNPSTYKSETRPVEGVAYDDVRGKVKGSNWPNSGAVDAESFLGRLRSKTSEAGFDLPTEAQWEYACRAGSGTAYFWGNALNGDRANCDGNYPCGTTAKGPYKKATCDVGSYAPNVWGLYDTHGNVFEWCADWYDSYKGDATDPTGPSSGTYRVYRGGSWSNLARICRSASRDRDSPGGRFISLGFRLCCSAGPLE